MTRPSDGSDDPTQASAEEEEELRRLQKAILARSDRQWWQLLPRKTLFKAFWLLLLLFAILWLRKNAGHMAGTFEQSLSPDVTPRGKTPPPSR